MKPTHLLKTYEKNVYKCIGFLYENYQQQAYTQYNDTTACVNWPTIEHKGTINSAVFNKTIK